MVAANVQTENRYHEYYTIILHNLSINELELLSPKQLKLTHDKHFTKLSIRSIQKVDCSCMIQQNFSDT